MAHSEMRRRRLLLSCVIAAATVTFIAILRPSYLAIVLHPSTAYEEPTVDTTLPKTAGDNVSNERYRPQHREREDSATRLYGLEHEGAAGPYLKYITSAPERITTGPPEHEESTTELHTAESFIIPEHQGNIDIAKDDEPLKDAVEHHDTPEPMGISTDRTTRLTGGSHYTEKTQIEYGHIQHATEHNTSESGPVASATTPQSSTSPTITSPPTSSVIFKPKRKFHGYVAKSTGESVQPSLSTHSENTHVSLSKLTQPSTNPTVRRGASPGTFPRRETGGVARSGLGYALTFTYFDQLTAAAVNLLSLMCLTSKFGGVRVVEPFVVNSDLGLNASKNWTQELRFRDINDMSVWKKHVSTKHYKQFVSFETFVKDAPRKVLLVQYYYPCGDQRVWNMAREFCDSNGFELVGKVCLRYGRDKMFTVNTLRNQIYSRFKKTEVVIFFEIYGGIEMGHYTGSRTYRLYGEDTNCERETVFDHYRGLQPSPSVFSDANAYIEKYLNGSSSYISLMVRLEKILRSSNGWNGQNSAECSRQCLNNTLKRWRDVKQQTGITTTFLAIDVGRYGSNEFHIHPEIEHPVLPSVEEFVFSLFDTRTSLQEWEDTFSSVGLGRTRNPGYIAMMQKVIAVKGNVLMLVGAQTSSAFQTTGIGLYHSFHGKGQIIELSKKCS